MEHFNHSPAHTSPRAHLIKLANQFEERAKRADEDAAEHENDLSRSRELASAMRLKAMEYLNAADLLPEAESVDGEASTRLPPDDGSPEGSGA